MEYRADCRVPGNCQEFYERMETGDRLTITATITDYEENPPNRPS